MNDDKINTSPPPMPSYIFRQKKQGFFLKYVDLNVIFLCRKFIFCTQILEDIIPFILEIQNVLWATFPYDSPLFKLGWYLFYLNTEIFRH